ncbi:MAG TPA: sulfatase-like hydrolase/transferase, partial [Pirellulaceae bacterium]|nr:sulfatase-like hydrolase/transferase [Pirellulaceae bacterium]
SPFRGAQNNPIYAAMLESLDSAVGVVLDKLTELKLDENTLVIFTSDNGGLATTEGPDTPATSNAPLREGKGWLYEGGLRVPLIVRWPGRGKSGATEATPACSVDIVPTVLEACGLKAAEGLDGVSLTPLLTGAGPIARDALYWHYPHHANQGGRPGGVVRSGEYKLIEFYENGRLELFNVAKDVSESRNLAEQEPERVKELATKLKQWRESVGAQMPSPNPNYKPNPQAADGSITLPARTADVFGVMLRYEPMPHKNTLGFWVNPGDWARFEFEVSRPGVFELEALQGCGNGSGGSEVVFELDDAAGGQVVPMTVQETGGFQAFVPRKIGTLKIDAAGRHTLSVRVKKKPGPAVMDLRQVVLRPVANEGK